MKKHNERFMPKVRRALATSFACLIVVGVPILTLRQYGHFFHGDSRNSNPLPQFQARSIDTSSKPYHLFEEPLVSVTFDDGWEVTYEDALPLLQKYGIHTTQFVLSGVESNSDYLSWKQIVQIHKAGHEIGCHTVNHPDLRLLNQQEVMDQLTGCKEEAAKHVGTVKDFASPYGSADARTLKDISRVFQSQRNTNGDSSNGVTDADVNVASNFNRYNIIGMTVKRATTTQEIQQLIDYAIRNNGWLVLTYHQADDGGSKYGIDPKQLEAQLKVINHASVRVVTIDQALSSQKGGK